MKCYVIVDRSTETTKYFSGLNGWVTLPDFAIWYETETDALEQKEMLKDEALKIELIETAEG